MKAASAGFREDPAKIERICLICGKNFKVTPSVTRKADGGKYCSKNCHNISMKGKKNDAWIEVKCQKCGKLFIAPRYRKDKAMFCSRECTHTRFEKKCELCGKSFYNEPNREKNNRGKYCSKKYANLSMRGRHQTQETIDKIVKSRQKSVIKKPDVDKICEHCKKEFRVSFSDRDRLYCSPKCYFLSKKGKASKRKGIPRPDDKKYWTAERQSLLREIWSTNPKKEILSLFSGKSWAALLNQIHQMKFKRKFNIPKRPHSEISIKALNNEKEIVEQYEQGLSSSEIVEKFNLTKDIVLAILRKNNVRIRSNAEAQEIYQNKPEIRKSNSERAKRRLDNPEEMKRLLKAGKKSKTPYLYTDKDEMVSSKGEQEIANRLYKSKIEYEMDKPLKLGNKQVVPDFWLPEFKIFIEYWGYQGAFDYDERMKEKQELYKRYNIPLLEITYTDYKKKRIPKVLEVLNKKRD